MDTRRLRAARTSRAIGFPSPRGSIATRAESATRTEAITRTDSTSSDAVEAGIWRKGKHLVDPRRLGMAGLARGQDRRAAALVFKSMDYKKSPMDDSWRLHSMEFLGEKEIQEICGKDERIERLQEWLDKTAKNMGLGPGKRVTGPDGTEAHKRMQEALDNIKKGDTEILLARNDETGKFEEMKGRKDNPKDSVRLDWGMRDGKPTVCVEDHKFGVRGLDQRRTDDLVVKAAEAYPFATRILIFEGRPVKTQPNPE